MADQFTRTKLVLGDNYLDKLQGKCVAVFGLGGVGGHCVEALARSGITHLVLIDNDKINVSNINRQLIATHSTIGRKKTAVMKERVLEINPNIKVETYSLFYLPGEVRINFRSFDYVVDAIDTVSAKIDIIKKCVGSDVPIISALGCGRKTDPTLLEVTDISKTSYDPLAKVMRHELRKEGINHLKVVYSTEPPVEQVDTSVPGSTPFVPSVAGIIIASEVIKDLLK